MRHRWPAIVALLMILVASSSAIGRLPKGEGRSAGGVLQVPSASGEPVPEPSQPAGPPRSTPASVATVDEQHPGDEPGARPDLGPGVVVAAVDGRPEARGTYDDPLDLASALGSKSPLRPGGTLLLRGGVYRGTFTSTVSGQPTDPITIEPFPGEQVTIDGGEDRTSTLTVKGSDTWFERIELTKSDPVRRTDEAGSDPDALSRGRARGVDVFGARTKLLDMVVHDHGTGIGLWQPAIDAEVRGAIVFNNGWIGPDRGHGHGIYVQNDVGTKRIVASAIFNNFGYGIHAYGEQASVRGLEVTGVTAFGNGAPSGSQHPNLLVGSVDEGADRILVRDNVLFHRNTAGGKNLQLGYGQSRNGSVTVKGNHVLGGWPSVEIRNWRSIAFGDNDVWAMHESSHPLVSLQTLDDPVATIVTPSRIAWDDNVYTEEAALPSAASFRFGPGSEGDALTFGEWQREVGVDAGSSYSNQRRHDQEVVLTGDAAGTAILTVLNWDRADHVTFDPALVGATPGQVVEVRDAEDLSKPVHRSSWNGGPIEIELVQDSVAQPVGRGQERVAHTPVRFGVFVVTTASAES